MLNVLSYIGEKLNEERIIWGVGASVLLNHYGLIDKANDIDIVVDLKDIEKADKVITGIGEKIIWEKTDRYSTEYFYEYTVNGFEVDVMAGLSINYDNGIFEYIFDQSSISEITIINGVNIPLTSLEEWYVIYQLIPNKEIKVGIIKNYLPTNGIKKHNLLERALRGTLPNEVKDNIQKLLNV